MSIAAGWCLNTASAVDNRNIELRTIRITPACLNTASAVDNGYDIGSNNF